ncbi:hypothetical protein BIZ70_gp071 [Gordonia phage JSwag]|uniref:hypothetical protein n=1 Tax=Gordonia phage JSwag TaxID=1887649 RepID=UPI00084F594C|nr:hypothetical protein BIZ70_gp071 [Gordonia phage JSwag]AOE44452.1 hypothetical protein SEA_JSWAG_42 [Gordonia phage JSwag]
MPEAIGTAYINVELIGWDETMQKLREIKELLGEIRDQFPERQVIGFAPEYPPFTAIGPIPMPVYPKEF